MNEVLKEIMIRVVAGVIVVLVLALIFEILSRQQAACACKGPKQPDRPAAPVHDTNAQTVITNLGSLLAGFDMAK